VTGLLIRTAVDDLRVRDGVIVERGQALRRDDEPVLDVPRAQPLPGLHDHHLHLHAMAAALASVDCGPPQTADDLAAALRAAARRGPVRGVGYYESVAGPLDRDVLDGFVPDVPVRVQHRSGAAWFLNSAALAELHPTDDVAVEKDGTGRPTGRLLRGDHLLRARSATLPDLTAVGRLLASHGITDVTDATPQLSPDALASLRQAHAEGPLPQRLLLLGAPLAGRGDDVGPWKVLLDEAYGLDLSGLVDVVQSAAAAGRAVAFHAVTAAEAVIATAALREGNPLPGSRIEHGSVLPRGLDTELQALGVTVVTQPTFVTDRGDDYLRDVDPVDRPDLYRCRSLLSAGVAVAAGSDAPYGDVDPWRAVDAAVTRRTRSGVVLGDDERVDATTALALLLGDPLAPGRPRSLEIGAVADVCLRDDDGVAATVIAGQVVFTRTDLG
jgi:predicted amidohydrolase YtcJ